MVTPKDFPLWSRPPHLKHWLQETATFLEMYNKEVSLIQLLQSEKALLMVEKNQLGEALKTQEEKHKIAFLVLYKDKENVTKELEERARKIEAEMEDKLEEMTTEKDILANELEENMMRERNAMQAEMQGIREQLHQSNSKNVKLHAKLKTMAEMVKKYKTFHEELNTALKNVA